MYSTEIRRHRIEHLAALFPEVEFGWTMVIMPCSNKLHPERKKYHTVRTDDTAFSTLHNKYCTGHTDVDFSVLRYCRNLQALDIGHNKVTDISFLYDLPHLKVLILALNNISDITPIGSLKELEYLEIFRNYITDISPLANCENLVDLNLCNNTIRDYTPLMGLTKLRRLWIARSNNYSGHGEQPAGRTAELPDQHYLHRDGRRMAGASPVQGRDQRDVRIREPALRTVYDAGVSHGVSSPDSLTQRFTEKNRYDL